MSERPVRVCIDARLPHGQGGVETFVLGLARGFQALGDPGLALSFLTFSGEDGWLAPCLPPGAEVLAVPFPRPQEPAFAERLAQRVRAVPLVHGAVAPAYRRLRGFAPPEEQRAQLPGAPEAFSAAEIDVVHFTQQSAFVTGVPSLYHPHDLQHLHHPELFDEEVRELRAAYYPAFARQAALVAVGTTWVKEDVVDKLGVPADRVVVVPMGPPEWDDIAPAPLPEGVPSEPFALYPAVMWPHKNHVGLVEAVARLRAGGLDVPTVLTGGTGPYGDQVRARITALGVEDLVTVLGFVSEAELRALYGAARLVVVPTLFEAASFPVWEAFRAGVPVAAAATTSLPRQVGDAGVLFDPHDPEAIAVAMRTAWTDDELRSAMVARGRERLAELSWAKTARRFAALYRRLAGRTLSDDDRETLREPVPL